MILNRSQLLLLTGVCTVVGCSASNVTDGTACTKEARAGITVDVRDSVSNALVGRGSRIIAREGAVADTSTDTQISDGPFSLVFERAGTYTVAVTQTGYQPWNRAGVQVTNGTCHVNAVAVTARLQK
ncbi:MAG: hypothetical protein ABIT20_18450 [Gemmatimonadaceae bacterium]